MGTGLKADLIRNANETSNKKNPNQHFTGTQEMGGGGVAGGEEEKLQRKFASTLSWQKR